MILKIAIRADGGTKIGMGHIMRTLVLAKELSKSNEVIYLCKLENQFINSLRKYSNTSNSNGYVLISTLEQIEQPKNCNSKYINGTLRVLTEGFKVGIISERLTIEEMKQFNADMLITDSYDVDEKYFQETRKVFSKTAYIDDTNKYYFDVDFLINQNANGEDFTYRVNEDTKLLVGTKYVMLRDEFKSLPKKEIKEKANEIMITVGGGDPFGITEKVLSYIKDLTYNFHIIIGLSFESTEFIQKFKKDNIKFYYNANICEIMQKCDIAIAACGSTLYELAASGVPTLGIIIADNQRGIASKLNESGIIINLGWYDKIENYELIKAINGLINDYSLRKKMSCNASHIVDGKGAERIAKYLMENI